MMQSSCSHRALLAAPALLLAAAIAVACLQGVASVRPTRIYHPREPMAAPEDVCTPQTCGTPAHLSGLTPAAARAASVVSGIGSHPSYAGFFTTDAAAGNNMYFWYFPAKNGNKSAPLIMWLQGGPGGSSLFGLFCEGGPFRVDANLTLTENPYSWNGNYSMLFVDNPVGAGFSYTTTGGYCTDETCVASNLYSLLQQFFAVFTDVAANDFFVAGESYGGHYVPAIGYYIDQANKNLSPSDPAFIRLKGISIGDGWTVPIDQLTQYSELFFQAGLADYKEAQVIANYTDGAIAAIKAGDYLKAFTLWDEMINGDVFPYPNYFHNITGLNDYDNWLRTNEPVSFGYMFSYISQPQIRKAMNVGNLTFHSGSECEMHLLNDFMQDLRTELIGLLDGGYHVLVYNGAVDVIIGATLTETYLRNTQWTGLSQYLEADKKIWRVLPNDAIPVGYVRQVMNFTQAVVRNAGHIVPYDQPRAAQDMIMHWVENLPYVSYVNPTTSMP